MGGGRTSPRDATKKEESVGGRGQGGVWLASGVGAGSTEG